MSLPDLAGSQKSTAADHRHPSTEVRFKDLPVEVRCKLREGRYEACWHMLQATFGELG